MARSTRVQLLMSSILSLWRWALFVRQNSRPVHGRSQSASGMSVDCLSPDTCLIPRPNHSAVWKVICPLTIVISLFTGLVCVTCLVVVEHCSLASIVLLCVSWVHDVACLPHTPNHSWYPPWHWALFMGMGGIISSIVVFHVPAQLIVRPYLVSPNISLL